MNALATLTGRLTLPYRRGAEFLPIPLGADAGGATAFAPYDFAEYRARWGQDPVTIFYVITSRQDVVGDDLELTLDYTFNGAKTTSLTVPHGTRTGTGFTIPFPLDIDATLRFTSLRVTPQVFSFGTITTKVGGNTGNGTCVSVGSTPTTPGAAVGNYTITMTDATHFTVTAPGGEAVGTGVAGTAFTKEVKFLIKAGGTPFVAGDGFIVPVVPIAGKDAWEIVALLGTIAKLVWLLGAEKDALARVRDDVRNMRFVESAFGSGLDGLGKDMRVPRFPPRPYSIDDATVALWHLDEVPNGGPVTTVVDQTTSPVAGHPGHPGTIAGAVAGVPGKFGTGFALGSTLTTNGPTAVANATLHFAAVPGTILPGMVIVDLTTVAAIPSGTAVITTTATTVVMSQNATGAGVGSGDVIQFGSAIIVAPSAEFDIPANADVTIEGFVAPTLPTDPDPITLTTNGPTTAANTTLRFAAVPGTILPGMVIVDLTTVAAIPSGTAVVSATATTVVMSQNATGEGVRSSDAIQFTNPIPRAVIARRATETATGSTSTPGWSLCVVNARGLNANVLFALCDGVQEIRIFADVGIADNRFHHVAGIVDRKRKRARLFVDGVQRATTPIDTLGAITPPDPVRLGSTAAGNALSGTIDEVRISRVARTTFHPALGEDDEAYRARLRIFRHWVLPTPAHISALVNEVAPLRSDPAPYTLVEAKQPTQVAECPVRIVPATLTAGTAIALDGATPRDETVAGTPADDPGFDPSLDLVTYLNVGVDASTDPGGARMQAGTGSVLDALVARLAAAGTPGKLILEHSYDTAGPTPLHSVGRALRLRLGDVSLTTTAATPAANATLHFPAVPATIVPGMEIIDLTARSAIPLGAVVQSTTATTVVMSQAAAGVGSGDAIRFTAIGVLGALAHRAGFAYVRNLGPNIAVAVPAGERLAIRSAPAAALRVDVGAAFDLTIDPALPLAGTFSWTIITPGPARAHLVAHSADPPALQTLTTNGPTAAANATLLFAAVPATILPGMAIVDLTTAAVITAGTTVVSTTATTVVMSKNATGAGVGNGNTIQFRDRTPIVSRPRVRLVTDSPGDLAVRIEYGRGGRTRSGTLMLRVDPTTLVDLHALDTVGNLDPDSTAIVGTPEAGFDPSYLVTHVAIPAIDFGVDPNNSKMQVVARDALDALAALLEARATPGRLQVTKAFVPGAPGVESVGRRLVLGHETLDPGVLGALASRFFDYVARAGTSVTAFMRPDTWIAIDDAARTAPVLAEIVLGAPLNLAVVPGVTLTTNGATAAANPTLNFAAVPGTILPGMGIVDLTAGGIPTGTSVLSTTATTVEMSQNATGAGVGSGDAIQFTTLNGTYNWSTRAIGAGRGSFDTLVRPNARFTPSNPGLLVLALTYVARNDLRPAPYTFEIRLNAALDVPGTFIPKDQYDIIMNVLDAFHPIGVEVRTDRIRKHVREIEQDPTKAFPAYSFPNFRF